MSGAINCNLPNKALHPLMLMMSHVYLVVSSVTGLVITSNIQQSFKLLIRIKCLNCDVNLLFNHVAIMGQIFNDRIPNS